MNRNPRAALLPLYLKLYDDSLPKMRQAFDPFIEQVVAGLADHGVDVIRLPICRLEQEFKEALAIAQARDADLLITLHLAYSPSMEAVDSLTRTHLPVLMLDTTMDYDFGQTVDPERLLYNHGIHGVQDMACMMRRRGKAYYIVAGHFGPHSQVRAAEAGRPGKARYCECVEKSNVLARAADVARAALAARRFRNSRVVRIGEAFHGMGDFSVDESILERKLGLSVTQVGLEALFPFVQAVDDDAVRTEVALDLAAFEGPISEEVHWRSVRVGLGLRHLLEAGGFTALSANFQAFDRADGPVDTVPFLEISKAMSRGTGYAGEGDVLTAALVGGLLAGWKRTTFTEIFCPDWKGQSLFLSHMGEINPSVSAGKPRLCEKDFPFTPARNPVVLAAAPVPGPAVFVNLAPGPEDSFRLIVSPVEVLGEGQHPAMREIVRGWIRPPGDAAGFLEEFSRLGGTHHSALVIGEHLEAIQSFAQMAGLECRTIT